MTEKRFRSGFAKYDEFSDEIIDELTGKHYFDSTKDDYVFSEEIVDLLNEQHETNQSLKIENDELKREVNLLTEFFRKNNFSLDDFNEWLTKEKWGWEAKEAWSERFGDLND